MALKPCGIGDCGHCLLLTLFYALSVANLTANNSSFDWGLAVGGYLGLLLMAASFIALVFGPRHEPQPNRWVYYWLLLCFAFYIIDIGRVLSLLVRS